STVGITGSGSAAARRGGRAKLKPPALPPLDSGSYINALLDAERYNHTSDAMIPATISPNGSRRIMREWPRRYDLHYVQISKSADLGNNCGKREILGTIGCNANHINAPGHCRPPHRDRSAFSDPQAGGDAVDRLVRHCLPCPFLLTVFAR